jgi:hypothetical protein
MMQKPIENIKDLCDWVALFFDVDLSNINIEQYNSQLPDCLRYLYAIEDFFAIHDCKFDTIRFFNNQFHLIPYAQLKLEIEVFDIVYENQNNWRVAYHQKENAIYLSEHFELPYNTKLNYALEDFLISFALHEIVFNCNDFKEINETEFEVLHNQNKILPLLLNKTLIDYPIDFYTSNNNEIVMQAGWIVIATNKEKTN